MKRDNAFYLMRDIISCFPNKFESNFLAVINHHSIAKNAARKVLLDEIKKNKPEFRILAGSLIIQNAFLRQMERVAVYEINEIIPALKFCFRSAEFKKIKQLSAEVILRLFVVLYFEYIIMPSRKDEGREFLNEFRKYFKSTDIIDAMNTERIFPRFIFECHGVELGFGIEGKKRFREILDRFYEKS